MATVTVAISQQQLQPFPPKSPCLMTPLIAFKLPHQHLLRLTPAAFRLLATTSTAAAPSIDPGIVTVPTPSEPKPKPKPNGSRRPSSRNRKVNLDAEQLKLNWLESLSCPLLGNEQNGATKDSECGNAESGWVVGVDPDVSGALAVLKPGDSAQVFDSPHLKVLVGKGIRRRLDPKSIIQLLQNVNAPIGTTAYIEQSIPLPQDGKQGWWSGGFGYGLWIGVLVASGYSVVPVPSMVWKNELKLAGSRSSKDISRELASSMFPSLSSLLKRKKDHGRAEALLIAAYGKGLMVNHTSSCVLEDEML